MVTSRQRKTMSEMTNEFTQADKKHGFDLKAMAFYFDDKNDVVVVKVDYARTLANMVDGDMDVYVIDKKGKMFPLSFAMGSIKEQLAYLEKLEVINSVK
jgi:hypothetical protein